MTLMTVMTLFSINPPTRAHVWGKGKLGCKCHKCHGLSGYETKRLEKIGSVATVPYRSFDGDRAARAQIFYFFAT